MNARTLDRDRLDAIYQYILAIAALSGRKLGPIHFLKYAYLADLAHAERREGLTFSGVNWRFYHFGPWSSEAFEEIAASLEAAAATEFRYPSQYGDDDVVRFGLERSAAETLAAHFDSVLPFIVSNAISRAVDEHGSDTADLLRHVYLTKPMLAAKPGDDLDFMVAARPSEPEIHAADRETPKISASDKRRRAAILESARAEVRKRLAAAHSKRVAPSPAPRYDAVFYEGTAQLDRLAGDPVASSSGKIEFEDSIWESPFRRDPEVS